MGESAGICSLSSSFLRLNIENIASSSPTANDNTRTFLLLLFYVFHVASVEYILCERSDHNKEC